MKLKAESFMEHNRCNKCGKKLKGTIIVVLQAVVAYDVEQIIQWKPNTPTEFYCDDCWEKP